VSDAPKPKLKPDVAGLPRTVGAFDVARVPFAGSSALPVSFLDETIKFWQPRSERTLTREDAREMIENMTGFFNILDEWYEAERLTNEHQGETVHNKAGVQVTKRGQNKKRVIS